MTSPPATALRDRLLDEASEAALARHAAKAVPPQPARTPRTGPTPPPGLAEGLEVANRLRGAVSQNVEIGTPLGPARLVVHKSGVAPDRGAMREEHHE